MSIEIVTRRSANREALFQRLVNSLKEQTDQNYRHSILTGATTLEEANAMLCEFEPTENYVMVLDDDNFLVDSTIVYTINQMEVFDYSIIMVRHQNWYIYDDLVMPLVWKQIPQAGQIDMLDFIVSRRIYNDFKEHFRQPRGADWHFISEALKATDNVFWLDRIVARLDRVSSHNYNMDLPATRD